MRENFVVQAARLNDTIETNHNTMVSIPYLDKYKGLTFEQFWEVIGQPVKDGIVGLIWDYEENIIKQLQEGKNLWVKKATGLGITELLLRYIAWACYNKWTNANICIVTGPRLELSITLIDRLKKLFNEPFTDKNTVAQINGNRIEAFPSHHLDAMRGLDRVEFIFLDEADFFNPSEQDEARAISERYFGKFGSQIVMVSTPNLPGGLFERMEKDRDSRYEYVILLYPVGLGKIYRDEDIEEAKKSPSFEMEYNGKYGIGIGNIFPYQLVDLCTESYDLTLKNGQKVLAVDPAYGSSKFAVVGIEKLDKIIYVKEAQEFERAYPGAMTEWVINKAMSYPLVLVDSFHAGLIREVREKHLNVLEVPFNKELSNMTMEAAQAVKELRVRIHPAYADLLAQLKSVKYNDKGHPNKKELTFDLGDAFMMAVNQLKINTIRIIKV